MKILYLLLLTAAAFFYPMYKDDLSFLLLVALLLMPIFLLALLIISGLFVKVKVKCESETAQRAKPVKIRVRITNRSFLPISCCTVMMKYRVNASNGGGKYKKHSASIPLPARTSESIIVSVKAEHCGSLTCIANKVRLCDFLGVFTVSIKIGFKREIPVLPAIYPYDAAIVSSMNSEADSDVYSQTRSGDDPSEVFALREYRDGDRQNRIHWKLSSRGDELVVKELSDPVGSRVLLLPDLPSCKTEAELDGVLELFASVSYFMAKKKLVHSASGWFNGLTSVRIRDTEDLTDFLSEQVSMLGDLQRGAHLMIEYINAEAAAHHMYSHVILFSARADMPILRELELICPAERISVLCLGEERPEDDALSKISETVVYYTSIDTFYEDLALFTI